MGSRVWGGLVVLLLGNKVANNFVNCFLFLLFTLLLLKPVLSSKVVCFFLCRDIASHLWILSLGLLLSRI